MLMVVRVGKSGISDILNDANMKECDFMELNGIKPNAVHQGMSVIIRFSDDIEYVARPFDNIDKISKKFGVSADYIKKYNNIDKVFLGDKIYIEK